nr:fructose-bisphosphatase class III [Bacilli bacterium]
YSLIFNSHHLAIAEHNKFQKYGRNTPSINTVEVFPSRVLVKHTDIGARLSKEKADLQELIAAYDDGLIKQVRRKK